MHDKTVGGVEEVAVIALAQQCLRPRPWTSSKLGSLFRWSTKVTSAGAADAGDKGGGRGMRAKLLHLEGHLAWKVDWTDPVRQEWHRKKMQSKVARAALQLQALGLANSTREVSAATAVVWHIQVPPPELSASPTT